MAISHSKSVTIADFTGTVTVFNSLGATQTANATDLVRPTDWNSVHNQYITLTGNTNNASTASGTNVVFSGGNGVTLIGSNSVVGISVNTSYLSTQSNQAYSAGNGSAAFQTITFADSNGVSFSTGTQGLYATVATSYAASNHSHGNPTLNLTNLSGTTASNSAGLTLSLSAAAPGAVTLTNYATGNTTQSSSGTIAGSSIIVRGSNGISAGISNGSYIIDGPALTSIAATGALSASSNGSTISLGVGTVTASATGNTTQSSSGTINLNGLIFQGTGGVSVGVSNGSVVISGNTGGGGAVVSNAIQPVGSATGSGTNTSRFAADDHVHEGVFSVGVSTAGNTSGDTRVGPGRFVLQGGNNVTLSQITAANALNTIVISGGAAGAADGVNALVVNGGASTASTTLTLSNSNNVSFGHNAGVITATATFAAQSAIKALGVSNTGQTAGNTGVSTGVDWVLAGSQSITLSQSTAGGGPNTIWVQHPAWLTTAMQSNAATISNINVSAGTTSTNASAFTFANSNGITFGLSTGAGAGQITASHNGLTTAAASDHSHGASASNGSFAFQTLNFSNANNVTFGTSAGGIVTASVAAPGAAAVVVSDTATSLSVTRIALTNSNNITMTWSTSNNSAVTLIASFSQTNQAGSVYAVGNTSGTSSGTYDARTLSISAAGAMTAAASNSGYILSVPATSNIVGTSGISVSSNGSTISVQHVPVSHVASLGAMTTLGTAQGNSLVSIQRWDVDDVIAFSNVMVPVSVTVTTAGNASSAYLDVSATMVLYTRNGVSLNSVASFNNGGITQSWNSNTTGSVTGPTALTMTNAGYTATPGEYWAALHISTTNSATGGANTTALGNTISVMLSQNILSNGLLLKPFSQQTNASYGGMGLGMISTGATRASIGLSDVVFTGTRGQLAPFAFELRSGTWWG